MGYYVEIIESTAVIPKENLDIAYRKMCALNKTHHHLKNGGSWCGGTRKEAWFSWMDRNYPETCKDAKEILNQLGFYTNYDKHGNLCITGYDSKTGQEDLFLDAIKNYTTGIINWLGEDGETWITRFNSHTSASA